MCSITLFFQFGYNFVTLLGAAGINSAETADASHVFDVIRITFWHVHQTVYKLLACWERKKTGFLANLSWRNRDKLYQMLERCSRFRVPAFFCESVFIYAAPLPKKKLGIASGFGRMIHEKGNFKKVRCLSRYLSGFCLFALCLCVVVVLRRTGWIQDSLPRSFTFSTKFNSPGHDLVQERGQ